MLVWFLHRVRSSLPFFPSFSHFLFLSAFCWFPIIPLGGISLSIVLVVCGLLRLPKFFFKSCCICPYTSYLRLVWGTSWFTLTKPNEVCFNHKTKLLTAASGTVFVCSRSCSVVDVPTFKKKCILIIAFTTTSTETCFFFCTTLYHNSSQFSSLGHEEKKGCGSSYSG